MAEATQQVILVPVDFESASLKAIHKAKELGARTGAEVVLLHVYQLPVYTYPGLEPTLMPGFHTEVSAAASRALEQLASQSGGLRSLLREGDAANEIIAAAEEVRPAMIVMGTHGRKGVAHLFLGSVAEKVIRKSETPVLTVRSSEPSS
ncbi:universal stress protein [Chondromyces apiculatus]|uniref:Universal stress protein family n=1 Tax=Chondromyces apiculatus DSM 436 TaxID=1192034 RepID=A0A017T588_9BACT|nr:universal stress protein [Chondromyces apiculatus]EYF03970.1 Universal stress protein family [Chondromyces apiculatus DSM 436]